MGPFHTRAYSSPPPYPIRVGLLELYQKVGEGDENGLASFFREYGVFGRSIDWNKYNNE